MSCFLLCCSPNLEPYTHCYQSLTITWLLRTSPQSTLFFLAILSHHLATVPHLWFNFFLILVHYQIFYITLHNSLLLFSESFLSGLTAHGAESDIVRCRTWRKQHCWCMPTSRMCVEPWRPLRSLNNLDWLASKTTHGIYRPAVHSLEKGAYHQLCAVSIAVLFPLENSDCSSSYSVRK